MRAFVPDLDNRVPRILQIDFRDLHLAECGLALMQGMRFAFAAFHDTQEPRFNTSSPIAVAVLPSFIFAMTKRGVDGNSFVPLTADA
jgi:hypothetical protein